MRHVRVSLRDDSGMRAACRLRSDTDGGGADASAYAGAYAGTCAFFARPSPRIRR